MRKAITLLLALLLITTHSSLAFSQTPSNEWTAVQALRAGEKLVVKKTDGKQVKGEMIEASDNALTIDRDGKPLSIPRADVRQVHVRVGKAEKGKWAAIGAGIGAGAGSGIGAIKYSPNVDDSQIWIGMGFVIGAGVGAVTGLFVGKGKRKRVLVYTAN
ncbi:MAG TPA: hypothetical protein VFR78_11065 [Pyrinomonadaceae bacterium]|nr:hypothetical protein [Pyrinomonadaceae bacterium]